MNVQNSEAKEAMQDKEKTTNQIMNIFNVPKIKPE